MSLWLSLILVLVSQNAPTRPALPGASGPLVMAESSLRKRALVRPAPPYPVQSQKAGRFGVAVVEIMVGFDGIPTRIDVLQAPDAHVAGSLESTLSRWRFQPPRTSTTSLPRAMKGKLVFYFELHTGKPVVTDSVAMPQNITKPIAGRTAEIDTREMERGLRSAVLVDPRSRQEFAISSHSQAVNIPSDEFDARARVELPVDKAVMVDCSRLPGDWCRQVGHRLSSLGFTVRLWLP